MASLSSRASSFHCIRFLVLCWMSTKRASRYSLNRLALSSTCIFRRRKQPWQSTLKEGHTKLDMCGANPSSPSPSLWGWVNSEIGWVPPWTALPRAAKVMNVLISCRCTTSCTGKCSCYNKGIVCTDRCRCSGHCYGRSNPPPTPLSQTNNIAVM